MRLTTLPPSCAVVMKSGNLKPSGSLQACNGTALTLSSSSSSISSCCSSSSSCGGGVLIDAVSNSDYIMSNDWIMNSKGC